MIFLFLEFSVMEHGSANREEILYLFMFILGVAWYKGDELKGKFCFIKGDDYISTSGIKKLESQVNTGKARKRARVVLSRDEEDDSFKQGRIYEDPTYFVQADEVVHDQDTAEEGQLEDSTAGITVSTAPINFSTARESHSTAGRVVYGRRSKEARKHNLQGGG
ncbi:hypothetical protein Tco_0568017 [Tanacetum coccineum]